MYSTCYLFPQAPRVVVDQGGPQSMPAPSSAVMSSGPPVGGTPDVVGTLRVRGKFDFKSVSNGWYCKLVAL